MVVYIVVACGECEKFQVQQENKRKGFSCKVCGTKNSVRKVWAKSCKAKDVRPVCQSLNMKVGMKKDREWEMKEEARRAARHSTEQGEYFYDEDGYQEDGYREESYHGEDYHEEGYNGEGYHEEGYHGEGYHEEGYHEESYHDDGYHDDGYQKAGYGSFVEPQPHFQAIEQYSAAHHQDNRANEQRENGEEEVYYYREDEQGEYGHHRDPLNDHIEYGHNLQ